MRFCLTFVLLIQSFFCLSQDFVSTPDNISVDIDEVFSIPLELISDGEITAFQFDIDYNSDAFQFISSDLENNELQNHTVSVSELNSNTLRIIVYSLNNSTISSGAYDFSSLLFKSNQIPGEFSFIPTNFVSDSSSFYVEPFVVSILSQNVTFSFSGGVINEYNSLDIFVSLHNEIPVLATQFDVTVPNNFNIGSIEKVNRLNNHEISIGFLDNNKYRIIIYSTSSSLVEIGNDEIFKFQLNTTEINPGAYNLQVDNFEIIDNENSLLSPVLELNDIIIQTDSFELIDVLDLGNLILNESNQFTISITNNDNIDHQINEIGSFFQNYINLPLDITAQNTTDIIFQFTPNNIGQITEYIDFFHSGNESVSKVLITANVIALNFFFTEDQVIDSNNNFLDIQINCSQESKAYQFDLNLPSGFSTDLENISLIGAFNEFSFDVTQIDSEKLRFVIYSSNNQLINSGINNLLRIPLQIDSNVQSGYHNIQFSNCTIVGTENQNIYFALNTTYPFYYAADDFDNNYLVITNLNTEAGNNEVIEFKLINYEQVRAIQFDIFISDVFEFSINDFDLVSRAEGFTLSVNEIEENFYRFIIYSSNPDMYIDIGNDSIINLSCSINITAPSGTYDFNFENVTIVDSTNQNISVPAAETGQITIEETFLTMVINTKVFLESVVYTDSQNTTLMRDDLRQNNLIPLVSPYQDEIIITNEEIFSIDNNNSVVDWIWVEIIDSNDISNILYARSAILQKDGDIVDLDGISSLELNINQGYYFINIKHRNHITIKTKAPVSLYYGVNNINFTNSIEFIKGGINGANLSNGIISMYCGDSNGDGQVQNTDRILTENDRGINGYYDSDIDLNGQVQNTDLYNFLTPNLGKGEQF